MKRARPVAEEVLHRPHLVLADAGRPDHVVAVGGQRAAASRARPAASACAAVAVAERELVAPGSSSWRSHGSVCAVAPSRLQPRSSSARSARICFSGPTTGTSAWRSFPISAASMSRWTTVAPGANAASLPGHPVVEARADGDEQVAGVHRQVRPLRPVHAGPAEVELVRLRERALAPSASSRPAAGRPRRARAAPRRRRRSASRRRRRGRASRRPRSARPPRRSAAGGRASAASSRAGRPRPGTRKSSSASWMSRGMSTSTGPQRPVRATWNAAFMTCGISSTSWTSHECLTIGVVTPVMSHSWKASVPIRWLRTWPVTQTSGVESIHASAIGVTRLVAPGPGGGERDAGPARRTCVALGHVARALLVPGEDVAHGRPAGDRVVDRQDRPAGDAEDDLDALGLERAEDGVGAEHRGVTPAPGRTRRRCAAPASGRARRP